MNLYLLRAPRNIGLALLGPLVALVIAVLATSALIVLAGTDSSVGDFWHELIGQRPVDRILVDIVNQSAMLFLSATAAAIGFRMGLFNIGVEGQYTLAAYVGAVVAGSAFVGGILNVVLSLVAAMAVGALWASLAGVLRVGRGVSEVISTIMLNRIAPILISFFINKYGVHIGNSVRTEVIPTSSQLEGFEPYGRAGGSVWTLGIIAIVVGIVFSVVINRTRFGFDLRATGLSPTAATASGVRVDRMVVIAMALSGAVAGLVWMPALFGDAFKYGTTFQPGIGYTGIAVALLGRNRPIGMAFGAVLFSFLTLQSNTVARHTDISASLIDVTQGIAVLAVVVAFELVGRWRSRIEQKQAAPGVADEPAPPTGGATAREVTA